MKIRNPNYANSKLSTREGVFEGDALGTFDLPDDLANQILATPGWKSTRSAAIAPPVETTGGKKAPKGPGKAGKTSEATEPSSDASQGTEGASTGSDEGTGSDTKTEG